MSSRLSATREFTIWHIAQFLPWLIVTATLGQPFRDNSYLWHVRAGDVQLSANAVLTADPFSFTRGGEAWHTQSWLLELGYSRVDDRFGLSGADWLVVVFSSILLIFTGLIIYGVSKSVAWSGLHLTMSSAIFAGFLNPRPALAGLVLFASVVLAVRDQRLRWILPLLFWIWASIHGSFILGMVYLAVWAGAERPQRIYRQAMAIGGSVLLTAHGTGIVSVLGDFLGNREGLTVIEEWRPTNLLELGYFPLLIGILVLIRLAQTGDLRIADWWYIVVFVPVALGASRAAPIAWIALLALFARFTPRLPFERASTIDRRVFIVVIAILGLVPFGLAKPQNPDRSRFPVDLLNGLTAQRVFHDDVVGGWLTYTDWPSRKVFIDDRADLFGTDLVEMVTAMSGAPRWREIFDQWQIKEAVVPVDSGLWMQLVLEGWQVANVDRVAGYYLIRHPN